MGLGLVQPELDKEKGEIGEAVDDLQDICQLGYEEDDDEEELAEALEEIIEYVRTIAMLFYTDVYKRQALICPNAVICPACCIKRISFGDLIKRISLNIGCQSKTA